MNFHFLNNKGKNDLTYQSLLFLNLCEKNDQNFGIEGVAWCVKRGTKSSSQNESPKTIGLGFLTGL
jgi:hypothetical protein